MNVAIGAHDIGPNCSVLEIADVAAAEGVEELVHLDFVFLDIVQEFGRVAGGGDLARRLIGELSVDEDVCPAPGIFMK